MHSKLNKIKTWLEVFALGIGLIVGIAGSIIGIIAWTENRSANRLNVDTQQEADETKLNEFLQADPYLSGLWAEFRDETNVQVVAQKRLLLLVSTNDADFYKLCSSNRDSIPLKAQELNEYLWNGNHFYDERRVRLRNAYNITEWIYDQIEYSFDAHKKGMLDQGDFQGWTGYLDGLCTHPLFLAAFQDDCDKGFPSKDYCVFVRQRILAQPKGREVVSLIYSNMLDPAWANSTGIR